MSFIRKNDVKFFAILTFAFVFGLRLIFCMMALPIRTLSDELATISGAAYTAGYDWSAVVSNAGYYGVGFTSLLGIFFKIFDNPVFIYRGMLCVCALVQSLSVFIVFYILSYYMKISNYIIICLVAIASSFFVVTRASIVYNEHILILISWICMLILFKLIEYNGNIKKKRIYTFLLMICLAYSLTIHTRSIILWVAMIGTILFYIWSDRKLLISPGIFIITGILGYILSKIYVTSMQSNIWIANSSEGLRNATVPVPELSMDLFSVDKWHAWLSIIIGQLNTINIFSGGLVFLFLVIFIHIIWKKITVKKKLKKNTGDKMDLVVPVLVFFLLCTGMTIFAQSITWLPGAAQAINEGIFNNNYGTKAFTYIRYIGPYCGPLFFIGCLWLIRNIKTHNKIVLFYYKIALAVFVAVSVFWLMCIVPYFHQTISTNIMEVYIPFSFSSVESRNVSLSIILPATLVITVLFILYGIWIKKSKLYAILVFVCVLLIYEYSYNVVNWDLPTQKDNYYVTGVGAADYIRALEKSNNLPDKIYVQDVRKATDHQIYYELQFLLYDLKIIPIKTMDELPNEENLVVITNLNSDNDFSDWINEGYTYTQISDRITILEKYN